MNALTFKEKQDALQTIFKDYHRCLLQLQVLKERQFMYSHSVTSIHEPKSHYHAIDEIYNDHLVSIDELERKIDMYDMVIEQLSEDSKKIILHEFVLKKRRDWWLEYYSRSTYYRLKRRAMEEALFYFNCL